MKVYIMTWQQHGPSSLVQEAQKEHAVPWRPEWPHDEIKIGDTKIFVIPSESKTDGYELTLEDLEELVSELKKRKES